MDHRSDSKWVLTSKDGAVHPLPAGMIFIGRQECDILVDSASVDKRHAVIFFNPSDKCFHVKDLNSVTGTYLNGVRIPEQSYVKLNHMDTLRFGYGHEVFCVHKTTDSAVPLSSSSPKRTTPGFGNGDLVIREDSGASKTAFVRDSPSSDSSNRMLRRGSSTDHDRTFVCDSPSQGASQQLAASPVLSSTPSPPEDAVPHRMKLSSPPSPSTAVAVSSSAPSSPSKSPPSESAPASSTCLTSASREVPSPSAKSSGSSSGSAAASRVGSNSASPQKSSPSSPHSEGQENAVSSPVMQDADSLEDLSRTEDSVSTVREVLPAGRPPPKPTSLTWRPLYSTGKERAPPPPPQTERPGGKSSNESSPAVSTANKSADDGPSPVTPASETQASGSNSMAFTIHFDDDGGGGSGKSLALKDSIRKFAPPKPESELRTPSRARTSPVSKPTDPPPSAGGRRTPTSPLTAELTKRRWSGTDVRGGGSSGRGWNSDVESATRHAARRQEERLSDSASYLIQRMLNDGPARVPLPGPLGGGGSSRVDPVSGGPEQLLSPADDRSETGTYTVETDRVDPDVEEARRRIDEVFGVSPCGHPSSFDQYQRVRPEGEGVGGSRPRSQGGSSVDLGRPKRRLPTPPSERAPLDVFVPPADTNTSANVARKPAPQQAAPTSATVAAARKRLGSTGSRPSPPCSPPRTHRTTPARTPSNKLMSTSFGDGSFLRQTPAAASAASSGQRRSVPPQRKSWTLTGSEADLAAAGEPASEETASVVSDTSTEPSSHSSGSRGGPQMKLNRAFALRRARLGLPEVGGGGGLPPAAAGGTSAAARSSKTSHHGSNPNLSRQDGGRFSLRLPRGVRATDVGISRADLLRGKARASHQRTDSDPVAAYHRSQQQQQQHSVSDGESRHHSPRVQRKQPPAYISDGDDDGRMGSPVQFGRSASFGGHRDLALTPAGAGAAAEQRPHRGSRGGSAATPTSLSRGETFLKGSGASGAGGGTFVRSGGRKPERQSGDGESKTPTENGVKTPSTTTPGRRELSALDSLVISAIHQLSGKLRTSARTLIEKERLKYPENSDVRLMLEEVLPRVVERRPSDSPTDGNLTRELSSILKNLKRIEQSLEVLNSLAPSEDDSPSNAVQETATKAATPAQKPRGGFFYVDV